MQHFGFNPTLENERRNERITIKTPHTYMHGVLIEWLLKVARYPLKFE